MIILVVEDLSRRLVLDGLWAVAQPLIQRFDPRPQGGGTTPVDDRAVFTAAQRLLRPQASGRSHSRDQVSARASSERPYGTVVLLRAPCAPLDAGAFMTTVEGLCAGATTEAGL
jgi:hypothetical protein